MICPRCMFEQEESDVCVKCGVIISKFLAAKDDSAVPLDEVPGRESKKRRYKRVRLPDEDEGIKVTRPYRRILYAFIIITAVYALMVFVNNYIIIKNIRSDIVDSLETDLKHEFRSKFISEKIVKIGNKYNIEILSDKVMISFMFDQEAPQDDNINYIVNIIAPYDINIFGLKLQINAKLNFKDHINKDSLKALRLKDILGVHD